MFLAYISLLFPPSSSPTAPHPLLLPSYNPPFHAQLTPLTARSISAWFLLSGLIRLGAFVTWGDLTSGFQGWYDAALLSLVVPLWHYGVVEGGVVGFGSVSGRQLAVAFGIDGLGSLWMWWVRGDVLGA